MKRISITDHWMFCRLSDMPLDEIRLPVPVLQSLTPVILPHVDTENGQPIQGLSLYRREIQTEAGWKNCFVEFEAVDQSCRVFINSEEAGRHQGGYSRFRVPVPAKVLEEESFELNVIADNRVNEHVSPHFGDFTVCGGIPRPVSLLLCEDVHFDYLYYGTDGLILRTDLDEEGNGILTAEPHTVGAEKATLILTVYDSEGREILTRESSPSEVTTLNIRSAEKWNGRKNPALYSVEASLVQEGRILDTVRLQTGFRKVTANGEGLRLNGAPCFLKGVAKHQDRAEVFTAVSGGQIAEDFDLIDEIGANAVRLSHYQHPQAAYDECDRRGILCWAEIPMLKMTEDEALLENAKQQLTELILQNIHHPSVYCWGIQNEIAMFRDAPFMHERCRILNSLAKELDPGRLTACANLYPVPPESQLNGITDIVGYNYYFGWYYGEFADYGKYLDAFHAARPVVTVGISEYGADANLALHSREPKVKDYSEEYQALYHESVYPFLRERSWLWGSYVWNMFDFSSARRNEGGTKGVNAKGLVTRDRKIRKDAFYYYKAQWSGEPFLHICGERYKIRDTDHICVKIYTNCPEAALTVNGSTFATGKNNGNGTVIFENVPLQEGENTLRAACGSNLDEAVVTRAEKEPEGYRLPDDGQDRNVLNWFLQEEQKEDCYSIMDTAQQIMESADAREVIREALPGLYEILEAGTIIPMGLTMKSVLSRDCKDPEQIQRINKALQEIQKDRT